MEYKVVQEMLNQRGYKINEKSENRYIATKDIDKLLVIFSEYTKLNIDSIKTHLKNVNELGFKHVIIVYNNVITASAKKVINHLTNIKIEIFSKSELEFNITKHRLSKPHIKLTGKYAQDIKKKYGKNLPIILESDPQSRFYGFSRGDIIKIIRKNGIISYRIVK